MNSVEIYTRKRKSPNTLSKILDVAEKILLCFHEMKMIIILCITLLPFTYAVGRLLVNFVQKRCLVKSDVTHESKFVTHESKFVTHETTCKARN